MLWRHLAQRDGAHWMTMSGRILRSMAIVAIASLSLSCTLISETLKTGGEQHLTKAPPPPKKQGPRVIVFALDGAVPAGLMEAVHSGHAPNIASLLGKDEGNGLFEHAYAAPHALSVLPSSTIADWSSVFTGEGPARNGVPGDEWFERETATFYAPVPVSVLDIEDNTKTVTDDLVGKELKVRTLYEMLGVRTYVSMQQVHRGATYYTTVSPSSFGDLLSDLISGTLRGGDPEESLSGAIDRGTAKKLIQTIEDHGIPDMQVVYFPGIDIFTHVTENPLAAQVRYLELVTDATIGEVLDEYRKKGALENTYVILIADHSHIPTLDDEQHQLGTDDEHSPFAVVAKTRFRVRKASLLLDDSDKDYQAVLAYQGFMAYVYLADRSTCPKDGQRCDWKKPPRFEEDVIPVLRAFYRSNRVGRPIRKLKGTLDLIFARQPGATGKAALPYEIFDGQELVSIHANRSPPPRPPRSRRTHGIA